MDYPMSIRPLTREEGGGYLVEFPDLPGCMSDGETPEEAIANGREAVEDWIETAKIEGRHIPRSGEDASYSGKFLVRVARSLHKRLTVVAKRENISLNAYVASVLAETVGAANVTVSASDSGGARKHTGASPKAASTYEVSQISRTGGGGDGKSRGSTAVKKAVRSRG